MQSNLRSDTKSEFFFLASIEEYNIFIFISPAALLASDKYYFQEDKRTTWPATQFYYVKEFSDIILHIKIIFQKHKRGEIARVRLNTVRLGLLQQ